MPRSAGIGIQRDHNKDMRFNFIQLECTGYTLTEYREEICRSVVGNLKRDVRRDGGHDAMRESQRSLKQRWQSFVVIRIISLDARHSNAYLRCRVCLFISLSDPSTGLLSVWRSTGSSGTARSTSPENYKRDERDAHDTLCSPNYSALRETFEFLYRMRALQAVLGPLILIDEGS